MRIDTASIERRYARSELLDRVRRAAPELLGALALALGVFAAGLAIGWATRGWLAGTEIGAEP